MLFSFIPVISAPPRLRARHFPPFTHFEIERSREKAKGGGAQLALLLSTLPEIITSEPILL